MQNLMLSVEAGNDLGVDTSTPPSLASEDSNFVTGIVLFADGGIPQV